MNVTIKSFDTRILIDTNNTTPIADGLSNLFARRYIPTFTIEEGSTSKYDALIKWDIAEDGFQVRKYLLGEIDIFEVKSPPPKPYINEAPYFFIAQVLARQYTKKGYIMFTDSVSFYDHRKNRAYLLLGYPHTGKSTMLAIALANGFVPLSTENTVVKIDNEKIRVLGGTDVLIFDLRIKDIYGIELPVKKKTKHGYGIIDLKRHVELNKASVHAIYLLYCSYASKGASMSNLVGRKAMKILWHFATSVVRGDDYYDPYPLNISDEELDKVISTKIKQITEKYRNRFYEVFGSHTDVFRALTEHTYR